MYHVIVTTPEKWFAMTKSWREHQEIVETIKLVLIDEVHLLDDESRGPTLEALVCRMKSFSDDTTRSDEKFHERALRFVAVSGTIPNIEDLAEWIKKGSRINCKTFKYIQSVNATVLPSPNTPNHWDVCSNLQNCGKQAANHIGTSGVRLSKSQQYVRVRRDAVIQITGDYTKARLRETDNGVLSNAFQHRAYTQSTHESTEHMPNER